MEVNQFLSVVRLAMAKSKITLISSVLVGFIAAILTLFAQHVSENNGNLSVKIIGESVLISQDYYLPISVEATGGPEEVWLIVQPFETNTYWVQSEARAISDNVWQSNVYLGAESVGVGEKFRVYALANPKEKLFAGGPLVEFPDAERASEPVIIERQ